MNKLYLLAATFPYTQITRVQQFRTTMPTASATRRKNSSLQQFSLFLVIIATLLIIISCPASVSGSLSDQTQPLDNVRHNAPNALSFSRRGLKNANRLTVSGDLHGNADISGENRPRSASDLILSDVVLVSSIEGGIYGLDRNSGQTRWTLSPRTKRNSQESQASASVNGTTYGGASPVGFGSLVGTSYGPDQRTFSDLANNIPLINETTSDSKRRDELATGHEALEALQKLGLYVVDPSAGQVYVLSSSSDSQGRARTLLSKLPLSLPQLVELSPFSFPGDNSRVFAGHKSTSLVEIDVRSGKIGAVFGGQDAGVWCNSPVMQGSDNAECNDDGDSKEEWAYIGRTGTCKQDTILSPPGSFKANIFLFKLHRLHTYHSSSRKTVSLANVTIQYICSQYCRSGHFHSLVRARSDIRSSSIDGYARRRNSCLL